MKSEKEKKWWKNLPLSEVCNLVFVPICGWDLLTGSSYVLNNRLGLFLVITTTLFIELKVRRLEDNKG